MRSSRFYFAVFSERRHLLTGDGRPSNPLDNAATPPVAAPER